MIAAIASGLLGQIEGLAAPAAAGALRSVFGDSAATAKPAGGPAARLDPLSDRLRSVLLEFQAGQHATPHASSGEIEADDVGTASASLG